MRLKKFPYFPVRGWALYLALGSLAGVPSVPAAAQELSANSLAQAADQTAPAPEGFGPSGTNFEAQDVSEEAAAAVPGTLSGSSAPSIAFAPLAFPSASPGSYPTVNYPPANGENRCHFFSGSGLVSCLSNVVHDQPGIWTAPLHVHKRDAIWLVPLAAVTAAAFVYDNRALNAASSDQTPVRIANDFSKVGSGYTVAGAAVGIYVIAHFTHNERAHDTGVVALEALADAGIVSEVLKWGTNRFRPDNGPASGLFWPDGKPSQGHETELYTFNGSFPSGHMTVSWAIIHVLVDETPGNRWLHVGLYALGTGIGFARVVGRDHFPSDVVAGGALGYLLGGYVYRKRSEFYQKGPLQSVSLSPLYNAATRTYGMAVSFGH